MTELKANLTTFQVAKILGISGRTVLRLAQDGELDYFKIGKRFKFRETDVQQYIDSHYNPEE